jgi:hypothetical protein
MRQINAANRHLSNKISWSMQGSRLATARRNIAWSARAAPRLRGDRERRHSPDIMNVFNVGEEELAMQ